MRRIGAGGFGVVYEAFDRARQANVALKTLHRITPASAVKLKHEFRALTDVAHPGLLALHDLLIERDECFFTMELVRGVDAIEHVRGPMARANDVSLPSTELHATGVRDKIIKTNAGRRASGFDERRLRAMLGQLVDAVRALHAADKIHRDLKPSNVLVRDDGRLSILDYGLVAGLEQNEGGFRGTPAYAAPEQAGDGQVGPPADWYAVGVILYEALTGALPFEGSAVQVLVDKQQRDAPMLDAREAPSDLVELCAQLLRRDPSERPSGDEIAARLARPIGNAQPRDARFVGRTHERERLHAAFERRRQAVVALEGPSGIGKSALVRVFLDEVRARAPSTVVLSGRCSVRESVPYNAFDGVVDALADLLHGRADLRARVVTDAEGSALARVFPGLHELAGAAPSTEARDADEIRLQAFAALRTVLGRLADERPLVVSIDDWQWADGDSRALLTELLRGCELMVLLTVRLDEGAERPELPWSTETIEVGPLDARASHDLARALVGETGAQTILARAAGHPMFLHEIARAEDAVDLDDAIRARVARLDDEARRLVEILSIAIGPLEELVLARAAHLPPESSARMVEALRIERLVRTDVGKTGARVEPFHDRVREAVTATLDEPSRRGIHRAIADALHVSGIDDPHALVHHLDGAGARSDAARFAEQAAERAERALAFERAATLLRDRLRLGTVDAETERAIRRRIADALANAHRAVEAAEELLLVADASHGRGRAAALRRAAELLLISGDHERGRAVLARLLEEFDRPLPKTAAGAVSTLLYERARLAMRGTELAPRAHPAIDVEHADLLRGVAQGLGMADNLRAAIYQTRALRAALDLGDPARAAIMLAIEAIFRGSTDSRGRAETAPPLLAQAEALARSTDDGEPACWIEAAHAVLGALSLERPECVQRLATAEQAFRQRTTGQTWALDSLRLVRALCLRVLGNFHSIREAFPEYVRDARRRGDRYLETTMQRGSTVLFLCDDDVAAARASLAETRWARWEEGFHVQHWVELDALAEIDLYAGDGARTLDVLAPRFKALRWSLVLRLQRIRVLVLGLRGRLLLARGDVRACASVARDLEREGVSYASARAALLRAGIAHTSHRPEQAVSALREAIALGDRHGLEMIAAVARARLGALLAGDEGAALSRDAAAWLSAQRIRNAERMIFLESPGL